MRGQARLIPKAAGRSYDRRVTDYADGAALIDDPRVLRIAVNDNGEPLIDVRTMPALSVDLTRTDVQQLSDQPFQVRAGVAAKLATAQSLLPDGYQLQIKEGWRPIWVQRHLWDLHLDELRSSRPGLRPERLERENARFFAPPRIGPPHSTGGAVDMAGGAGHATGVPVVAVRSAYRAVRRLVRGPGVPSPMVRPSTRMTGARPPMVPVTNTSVAVYSCGRV